MQRHYILGIGIASTLAGALAATPVQAIRVMKSRSEKREFDPDVVKYRNPKDWEQRTQNKRFKKGK